MFLTSSCSINAHTQQLYVVALSCNIAIHSNEPNRQLIVGVDQKHCVHIAVSVLLVGEATLEVGVWECR